ncbi:hypothetical protein N9995_00150 [bacterium]|nr:hypothetical protein [bacterium]
MCRGHADGAQQKDATPNFVLIFGLSMQKEAGANGNHGQGYRLDHKHNSTIPAPATPPRPLYGLLASAMPSPSESQERFMDNASVHGRWDTEALAATEFVRADDPTGEPVHL